MAANSNFQTRLMALQSNMLNFAYMLTSNRDDAYDLLQDTTLKALDNADKYVDNTNFKGWVFTIMRNIFINNYRRMARTATVIDQTEDLYHLNLARTAASTLPKAATPPPRSPTQSTNFPKSTACPSRCTWQATSTTR